MSDLKSTMITNTIIRVMWESADSIDCGPVLYYEVTIMNSSYTNTIKTSETNATFSDLINGTNYTISVAAVNRAGTGPSSMITETTLSEGKVMLSIL